MNSTWRLATLVIGGLGFTFCGGCFCVGFLFVTKFVPRMGTGNGLPLPLTARQMIFAIVMAVLTAGCFLVAVGLVVAGFRFERVAR